MAVDIWFQQTNAANITTFPEDFVNLWGEGNLVVGATIGNQITNLSGVQPIWISLNGVAFSQTGQVGHGELPEYYRITMVDNGSVH